MKTKYGAFYSVNTSRSIDCKNLNSVIQLGYQNTSLFTGYEYLFKGYEADFAEDLFKIVKVIRGDLNVYELEDLEGESIIGKFYEEELSGVDKKDDVIKLRRY